MPIFCWPRLFFAATAVLCTLPAQARPVNRLHWERIHVYQVEPSVVFTKLGLTHSTKNGYTRDGKQGVPDPTFPPGLTDVVPYDAEKLLLVRGTESGLSLFRSRVSAADRVVPPVHFHAELARAGADTVPIGTQDVSDVADGVKTQISLGTGDAARVYQITERANLDGTVWIACRVSLPLSAPPEGASTGTVFVPERIWTDPISRKVHPGETAQFDDFASLRQAAAHKLGADGPDAAADYTLRITLLPN